MKYLRYVVAHLARAKRRTFLTVSSIALALFLFCTLRTVMTSFDAALRASDDTRLVVRHAASLVFPLPLAYRDRLAQIQDVEHVGYGNWFGGFYQDPKNQIAEFAVDVKNFFLIYPEILLPADQRRAFEGERTACLIGRGLAKKYGWKLGDVVPITGTIYPGEWRLTVRGIYAGKTEDIDENTIFFNWEYLNESMPDVRKNWVGIYWLRLHSASLAPAVSDRVDAMFQNSPQPTKTETEKAFQAGFLSMMGNVSMLLTILGSAIVFAIMLVTVNTMLMAARERTTEIAVLKTLGFSNRLILMLVGAEAVLLSLAGGIVGSAAAYVIFRNIDFTGGGMFANFRVLPETIGFGLLLAVFLGLLSGLVPAIQASRLQIAGALRKVA
ncbi:MAG TPA: FtsX-like permease family protein [Candidatus Limnocylindrales bacterium]|nr:FtsX-like permease family protein [Candidatus Limnocylindrales bacterium]